jgi:hypothetical protein
VPFWSIIPIAGVLSLSTTWVDKHNCLFLVRERRFPCHFRPTRRGRGSTSLAGCSGSGNPYRHLIRQNLGLSASVSQFGSPRWDLSCFRTKPGWTFSHPFGVRCPTKRHPIVPIAFTIGMQHFALRSACRPTNGAASTRMLPSPLALPSALGTHPSDCETFPPTVNHSGQLCRLTMMVHRKPAVPRLPLVIAAKALTRQTRGCHPPISLQSPFLCSAPFETVTRIDQNYPSVSPVATTTAVPSRAASMAPPTDCSIGRRGD